MITGTTKIVGLLGWPVEHSLSPAMHNATFCALGLDYEYLAFAVSPQELPQALAGAKALGFSGLNVTIPHKVKIIPYLDGIDRSAELVGAVNTVVFEDGRAIGHNTDADGFVNSLRAEKVAIAGKRAVVLGAGGAARAIVHGLLDNGVQDIAVGARDKDKALTFAQTFGTSQTVRGYDWGREDFAAALAACDILIHCTPVGMSPHEDEEVSLDWEVLNPAAVVCDLIYTPLVTRLLHKAAAAGHKTVGGAGMLVEQGAAAFSLWTGLQAPRAVMHKALSDALASEAR